MRPNSEKFDRLRVDSSEVRRRRPKPAFDAVYAALRAPRSVHAPIERRDPNSRAAHQQLIAKTKQGKIDIIVLGGYHTAGALIIKQSREQGLAAQMVGFDSLETAEFAQLGGAATNGVLMSFPPKAEDDPKNAALVMTRAMSGFVGNKIQGMRGGKPIGFCPQTDGATTVPVETVCSSQTDLGGVFVAKAANASRGVEIAIVYASHVNNAPPALLSEAQRAAEKADGAFTNFLPLSGLEKVTAPLAGAPEGFELLCRFFCIPGPREAVEPIARFMFASYATVPVYREFFRWLGHGPAIEEMVQAWAAKDRWGGMVDKLIADIANTQRGDKAFPFLRNFDPYEGHSWASGIGLGEFGNNQESSSEAVAAWVVEGDREAAEPRGNQPKTECVATLPQPFQMPARPTRIVIREMIIAARRSIVAAGYLITDGSDLLPLAHNAYRFGDKRHGFAGCAAVRAEGEERDDRLISDDSLKGSDAFVTAKVLAEA